MASMSDKPGDLQKQPETMRNLLIVGAVAIAAVVFILVMISIFGGGGGSPLPEPCG